MPSMSYCMFENTSIELDQCVEKMAEASSLEDMNLNKNELRSFYEMWDKCRTFLAEHERLLNAEVTL